MSFMISPTDRAPALFRPAPPSTGRGQMTAADMAEVERLMEHLGAPTSADVAARLIATLSVTAGAYSAWALARLGPTWQGGQRLDDARKIMSGAESATWKAISVARNAAYEQRPREGGRHGR